MSALVVSLTLLFAACASAGKTTHSDESAFIADAEAKFREFRYKHLKSYASASEESLRFENFVANMKKAKEMESSNPLASFGATRFADMSEAEFASLYLNEGEFFRRAIALRDAKTVEEQKGLLMKDSSTSSALLATAPLADRLATQNTRIDWREKGAVSRVKDQGPCGSCWAFSTTGNVEGAWVAAGNTLAPLSEQFLVSCVSTNRGCGGGLMDNAYAWLLEHRRGEMITEEAYPYAGTHVTPHCKSDEELDKLAVGAVITGYTHLEESEDTLAAYVAKHPIAIAVDATSFQTYRGGILTNCISRQINHAVLAVGFDTQHMPPYWIIKNSWGPNWGESGYVRIAKGSNQCLVTAYATTAAVKQ